MVRTIMDILYMYLPFLLLKYFFLYRFLGQNTVSAYHRAKVGSLNIGNHVTTISGAVTVDLKTASQNQPENL